MNRIPFISQHYTVHPDGAGYVVKCDGQIIIGGRFNNSNEAEERAYQLNRARNL